MFRFFRNKLHQIKIWDLDYKLQAPPFKSISLFSISANQPSFTANYLINSCGFSPETAISVGSKINLENTDQPDSVLNFLRNHGFNKTHVTELITKRPKLLQVNVEKTLKPKLQFFWDLGLSSSEVAELIATWPDILAYSLKNSIEPTFDFLKSYVHTNQNAIKALKRCTRLLTPNINRVMLQNISILQNHGVPISKISSFIMMSPQCLVRESNRFSEIVVAVEELGIEPSSRTYILAVRAMSTISKSTWEGRLEVYRSLGLSEKEIISVFVNCPMIMIVSEKKIRKVMDFLVNKLNLKPLVIVSCPLLLIFSLESQTIPRCNVMQILISKGLIRENLNLLPALVLSKKNFLQKYVTKFQEQAPDVVKVYRGEIGSTGLENAMVGEMDTRIS